MSDSKNSAGLVVFCNEGGIIEEVLYSDIPGFDKPVIIHKSFISLAASESLDKALQFLSSIRQFGHAAGWHILLQKGEVYSNLCFMGAKVSNGIILTGYQLHNITEALPAAPEDEDCIKTEKNQDRFETEYEIEMSAVLEELSRVNNELINVKRELIQKNKMLEHVLKKR